MGFLACEFAAVPCGLPEMSLKKELSQPGVMSIHAYINPATEAYTHQLPMIKQDFPRAKYDEDGNPYYVTMSSQEEPEVFAPQTTMSGPLGELLAEQAKMSQQPQASPDLTSPKASPTLAEAMTIKQAKKKQL